MNRLSDNFGHIGDRWVIRGGRYAAPSSMNQRLLSTTGQLIWAIEGVQMTATQPPNNPIQVTSTCDGMAI
ncbi:MAG: hypothetical protein D4R98_05040 [Comamonadaceae bacterium]|nr:MAG: hypothetical protein D4R98_05040 [Comamonadaceae bacterium]